MSLEKIVNYSHSRSNSKSISFILGLVVFSFLYVSASESNNNNNNSNKHVSPPIIVISFDGFRYDYFKRWNTTNMDYLVNTGGIRAPYMRNQFVTKTFPNHQSIVTGLYTESHGVVDSKYFDPEYNRTFSVHDGDQYWKYDDRVVPLWTLNEWAGGRSGVCMWPGSEVKYGPNQTLPSKYVPWNETYSWEWRVDTSINWLTDAQAPVNLLFLYFEDPDELAHAYGPESSQVTEQIARVDNITGYLINKLKGKGLFEKVDLLLLSDHGFYELEQKHIINLTSIVDPSLYEIVGFTPVLQLKFKDEASEELVYTKLKNESINDGHFQVYKKSELPERWKYKNNRRIMPVVVVADLGYAFDDFYSDIAWYNLHYNFTANSSRVYGIHGYDNKFNPMHAFFMARGPSFQKGFQETVEPFDNIDLFPLICLLLGIETPPNNGSLASVRMLIVKKHGFDFRSGLLIWVVGAAVLLGLVILFTILSTMIVNRRNDCNIENNNGYRVKFNKENFQEILEDEDVEITIKSGKNGDIHNDLMMNGGRDHEETKALLSEPDF